METNAHDRVQKKVNMVLHQLLDHQKSVFGLTPEDRLAPEQFFPVDPRVLTQLLGWTVETVSMVGHTTSLEELTAKCIKDKKKIILLSSLSEEAKRYTLAHELGHVLLHTETPDCNAGVRPRVISMLSASDRKSRTEYSDIEREAEIFARELLMPERAVRRHFCQLFAIDRIRTSSPDARKFAPDAHDQKIVERREVASVIAGWKNSSAPSLVEFFGVSRKAMANRLIGLYLVY
jgi:hypothetical protein